MSKFKIGRFGLKCKWVLNMQLDLCFYVSFISVWCYLNWFGTYYLYLYVCMDVTHKLAKRSTYH